MNDPYHGRHAPARHLHVHADLRRRRACAPSSVVICHHTDVGGRVPGSNAADSTEIYQEGLRIPPLKLYERGVAQRDAGSADQDQRPRARPRARATFARSTPPARSASASSDKLLARYGADEVRGLHARAARLCRAADARGDRDAGRRAPTASPTTSTATAFPTTPIPHHGRDHRARRRHAAGRLRRAPRRR